MQRNSASVRPLASSLTTASHTCVLRPRCWALATQATAQLARASAIYKDQKFSDHAPITIDYALKL